MKTLQNVMRIILPFVCDICYAASPPQLVP